MLPILSMVDRRKAAPRDGGRTWRLARDPHASVVEKMGLERAPLSTFAPKSPAAKAVRGVWEQVLGLRGK
jgi:hypothetical protein